MSDTDPIYDPKSNAGTGGLRPWLHRRVWELVGRPLPCDHVGCLTRAALNDWADAMRFEVEKNKGHEGGAAEPTEAELAEQMAGMKMEDKPKYVLWSTRCWRS